MSGKPRRSLPADALALIYRLCQHPGMGSYVYSTGAGLLAESNEQLDPDLIEDALLECWNLLSPVAEGSLPFTLDRDRSICWGAAIRMPGSSCSLMSGLQATRRFHPGFGLESTISSCGCESK